MAKTWMLVALAGFTVVLGFVALATGAQVGYALHLLRLVTLAAGVVAAARAREWVWIALIVFFGALGVLVYGIYALLAPPKDTAPAAPSQAQAG